MNLVFKNNNAVAPDGAPKIYPDRRVNDGTITMIEFSNQFSAVGGDLNVGIRDLAANTLAREGIISHPKIGASWPQSLKLDEKSGLLMDGLTNNDFYGTGVRIEGVSSYLYNKQPNVLMLLWVALNQYDVDNVRSGRVLRAGTNKEAVFNMTVVAPSTINPYISVSIGNKSGFVNQDIGFNQPTQLAVEFVDGSTENRLYMNGVFVGTGGAASGSFLPTTPANDFLSIGGMTPTSGQHNPVTFYEHEMHDLSISGRTALDIVEENYNYVNGLGEFSQFLGVRRPYANLPAA